MMTKSRFILSKSKTVGQYNLLKQLCDVVSYSYKTNKEVGFILKEKTDSRFSIHSIKSVDELNCPDRIWFFGQGLTNEDISEIFKRGVKNFVIDNETDLSFLVNFIKKNQKQINLLLRMRLKEHTVHTGKHFVYGMSSTRINELLQELRDNKNIVKLGIHFHRKTQNVSEWSLKEELEESIEHWDKIDLVNIGGGLPGEYKNFRASVLDNIFREIKELKEWLSSKKIEMIIEPGRFIASSAVKLETNVVNVYDNNVVVDCSIFNAALDTWIANIRLLVEGEQEEGEAYTIKGITPDSADIIRYKVYLKKRPKIGDKIIFLNAGAYNFSTDFCNLPKLDTVVVD